MILVNTQVTLNTVDIDCVKRWCYNNLGPAGWTISYIWDRDYNPMAITVTLYNNLEIPLDQVKVLFVLSWNGCTW